MSQQRLRANDHIRVPEVRLIDEQGENLGVMPTKDALALARERGLDLVEVSPKARPPVCRVTDFGKFQYEQLKKERKQKAHSKKSKVKGIRLSLRISDNDFDVKVKRAEKFLNTGNKVKVEVRLRGRENVHKDLAFDLVNRFIDEIEVEIVQEDTPKKQGHSITTIIYKK